MADPRTHALVTTARTLIGNGHLTSSTIRVVEHLSQRLGRPVECLVEWSHISLVDDQGTTLATVHVQPEAINMTKVSNTLRALDALPEHPTDADVEALDSRLDQAAGAAPAPTWMFVLACITGACALGAIFGTATPMGYVLIALAAGLGGWLRRVLGAHGVAVAGQALAASLLAGAIGGIGAHFGVTTSLRLVAVCPAMVLVPGPHLINGVLDMTARQMAIGWYRFLYGCLILAAISGGLVVGLLVTGSYLPTTAPARSVPLLVDALAGAVAAGSYPVYFSMPRRQIVWPVLIGGVAHALHWAALSKFGLDGASADFLACLLVGLLAGPLAHRRHLSFAGIGFAGVVALVPGMYVFRTVAGMFVLTTSPTQATALDVAQDLSTALVMLTAIVLGLVFAHSLTRPHLKGRR